MAGEWPLVGRDRDLADISAARAAARAGGLLLGGPAGVGKTRLAREAAAVAERGGETVRWVRATRSASPIPLGAFAPLLPPEELGEGGAQLRRAADALRAGSDEQFLLVVDDVQFLDETSAALLLQLVVMGAAFLVATLRTGEDPPDAVVALWKDELVERQEVRPLSPDDVTTLLGLVLGEVEASTALALARASGGNPLYLRELVLAAQDAGTLHDSGGMWRLQGRVSTSPRLKELVSVRLGGLSTAAQRVLDLVAVGEPIGMLGLERLTGGAGIDDLERRGLIEVLHDERRANVRVAHTVYGEVVRESMTSRGYRDVCQSLANAVEGNGARRRDDKRRIAMWRLEAGVRADIAELLAAAHDSRVASDYASTERFARAARDAGGGPTAGRLLGEVLDELGRHDEAEAVLAAAAAETSEDGERTFIAVARADNLFRGMGRAEAADGVLAEVRAQVSDSGLIGELDAQLALNRLFAGRVQEVFDITEPMLTTADLRAYSQAALQAGVARFLAGRYDDAVETSTRGFEARIALVDEVQLADAGIHLVALSFAQVERGDIEHGIATARAGYEGAAAMGHRNGQAYFAIALARGHLVRGEVVSSARYAREAALLYGEFNHPGSRWGFGALALALAHAGDVARAEEALSDLDAEPDTPVEMMDPDIDRARAWVVAARGELPRARSMLFAAADRAAATGRHGLELGALFDVARLGDPAGARDRLAPLQERVQGGLAALRIDFVDALARGDAVALDEVAGALAVCGARLWAAEAANESAIAYRVAGAPRAASAAAQRAATLSAECEGARTPALLHGTNTAVLTRREREIATLAAQGHSSREIADALVVSPRTVENHLQRAYEKLGVRGRADLGEALTRASL
jgi:DNA-binding CsgD family transcriptional regulator